MAGFVSISRVERGRSPTTAQVDAEPTRTGGRVGWRVARRAREDAVELSDGLFRELLAPADVAARVVYRSTAASEVTAMAPGYDKRLYVLAFDHRGSFERLVLGSGGGQIAAADAARIRDAKSLIYEGVHLALAAGLPREAAGVLVDEQYGAEVAHRARADGAILAMPVETSGQDELDVEYGDAFGAHVEAFGAHVEAFDPAFAKVLVRYNPDGDAAVDARQAARLRYFSDWLHARGRRLLVELLIPATAAQLASAGGEAGRYDREVRPGLMVRAIAALQAAGVEPDIWTIEGLDRRADCARVAAQARAGGRDRVGCVVLGRGADPARVEAWLRASAPVPGYVGFAIGRSIFSAAVEGRLAGTLDRAAASELIAATYLRFVRVYAEAAPTTPGPPAIPAAAPPSAASAGAPTSRVAASSAREPRLDRPAPQVLVVDDDPAILDVLDEFVGDLGMAVARATNGAAALAAVVARRPDLVILDLRMPVLDGFEACRRLKADPATRAIPVVAVSADGNRGAALACGCDDFLAKPFDLDAIERVVRRWLA